MSDKEIVTFGGLAFDASDEVTECPSMLEIQNEYGVLMLRHVLHHGELALTPESAEGVLWMTVRGISPKPAGGVTWGQFYVAIPHTQVRQLAMELLAIRPPKPPEPDGG